MNFISAVTDTLAARRAARVERTAAARARADLITQAEILDLEDAAARNSSEQSLEIRRIHATRWVA